MSETRIIERCFGYLDAHFQQGGGRMGGRAGEQRLAVTLSRQAGSGGSEIAVELARLLEQERAGGGCPWTVFDKNLVEKVLEDHHLSKRIAEYMPEDRVSAVADAVEELFGLHPSASKLVAQSCETILRLAELGGVILVGRGSNVITARLPHVLHVRLVGTLSRRIARIQAAEGLDAQAAANHIDSVDAARRRYLQTYFRKDVDDPLLYDLVLKTDLIDAPVAARMIAEAVKAKAAALAKS